ncbi:MAG: pentapeptide repeat-containing protein, partial [Parvularculaceae bacterium]|nr:pentapeptide repeat-containing protein [Parvularculaceae bacterium]
KFGSRPGPDDFDAQLIQSPTTDGEPAFLDRLPLVRTSLRRGLGADLRGARFVEADLSGARLDSIDASGAQFVNGRLNDADFSDARMEGVLLVQDASEYVAANMVVAKLAGSGLFVTGVDLTGADLFRAAVAVDKSILRAADASFAKLGPGLNSYTFAKLFAGITWNQNGSGSSFACAALSGFDAPAGFWLGSKLDGADFRGVDRGAALRVCGRDVRPDRVFAHLDAVAKECGDEAEELKKRGLIVIDASPSGPRRCKAVDRLAAVKFTPDQVAAWESGAARVCAAKDRMPWFEDPTTGQERQMKLPDCHDPKVIRSWYGQWRYDFAKAHEWTLDPDDSEVMRGLCPLSREEGAPACDWAKVDALIAEQDKAAAEAKRREEAAKRPPPRRPAARPSRPRPR